LAFEALAFEALAFEALAFEAWALEAVERDPPGGARAAIARIGGGVPESLRGARALAGS
jgi:hypothetical protein